jgi:Na+/H+ antiporter NhaA
MPERSQMSVKKVYLPQWLAIAGLIMAGLMWLLVTYTTWVAQGPGEREVTGWVISTGVLAVLSVVLWLTGQRKLPVYLIDDGEE